MFVCMIVLCALCLYKLKFSAFREDYMGPAQTTAIKGIFAVLILLSHMRNSLQFDARVDTLTQGVIGMIGQLMVTMFFFYSGYGILEGYRKKANYAHGFLKNRFLKVLLHFDLAVVLLLCWVLSWVTATQPRTIFSAGSAGPALEIPTGLFLTRWYFT